MSLTFEPHGCLAQPRATPRPRRSRLGVSLQVTRLTPSLTHPHGIHGHAPTPPLGGAQTWTSQEGLQP